MLVPSRVYLGILPSIVTVTFILRLGHTYRSLLATATGIWASPSISVYPPTTNPQIKQHWWDHFIITPVCEMFGQGFAQPLFKDNSSRYLNSPKITEMTRTRCFNSRVLVQDWYHDSTPSSQFFLFNVWCCVLLRTWVIPSPNFLRCHRFPSRFVVVAGWLLWFVGGELHLQIIAACYWLWWLQRFHELTN